MFRRAGCVAALLWIFLPAVAEAETALQIVAHQDDDLYFINPAVSGSIARADSTWTVYVTAGDASRRLPQPPGGSTACDFVTYHWQCRELGMQAAYAAMAGVANSWVSLPLVLDVGKSIVHRYLIGAPHVHLVFLRIESPSSPGDEAPTGTLERLWDGRTAQVTTIEDSIGGTEFTYTRQELIDTLTELIESIDPDVLRSLDPNCLPEPGGLPESCVNGSSFYRTTVWAGADHAEHVGAARFTLAAHGQAAAGNRRVRAYRTYNIDGEPTNVSDAERIANESFNSVYYQFDVGGGPHAWNAREIAYGDMRLVTGQIALQNTVPPTPDDDECLEALGAGSPGDSVILSPCVGSDSQIFEATTRTIRHRGLCLTSVGSTSMSVDVCDGRPEQAWTWWTGRSIRRADGMCLGAIATQPVTADCASSLQVWELRATPATATGWETDFSVLEFGTDPSRYASLRLADVNGDGRDDACARRADGVYCALATSGPAFAPATRWSSDYADAQGWGPAEHGPTLMFGDLDDDGDADVCGRGNAGLLCAISNGSTGFATLTTWTTVFGDAFGGTIPAVYDSLRMGDIDGDGDADVCGYADATSGRVVCVRSGGTSFDAIETTWITGWTLGLPAAQLGRSLMLGDIDADGNADLCERGTASVRCALSLPAFSSFIYPSNRSLANFSDAQGWSALESHWHSLRLGDLNGDGMADLCGRGSRGVLCSFSVDGRFSKTVHHIVPGFSNAAGFDVTEQGTTLRLGDIDGNGTADLCAVAPAALECATLPVPEPGAIPMLAAGIALLGALKRRRFPS